MRYTREDIKYYLAILAIAGTVAGAMGMAVTVLIRSFIHAFTRLTRLTRIR